MTARNVTKPRRLPVRRGGYGLSAAWQQFAPSVSQRAMIHRSATDDYRIGYEIGTSLWWFVTLQNIVNPPGGVYVRQIMETTLCRPYDTVDSTTFGQSGTWVNNNTAGTPFGGSYSYTAESAASMSWTSPACTTVAVNGVYTVNAGYTLVAIDGSTTAANLLPTAQEEVTAGRLASTALVANGGTLNPTDRVLEQYKSSTEWSRWFALADGLANTTHTVLLTNTGYKRSASSGTRTYVSGWGYGPAGSPTGTNLFPVIRMQSSQNAASAWEYAWRVTAGSVSNEFIGSIHGYEDETSLTFSVDGDAATLASVDDYEMGSVAQAVRLSALYHPGVNSGATAIGSVDTRYTAARELRVAHETTWTGTGTLVSGYPAMMPAPQAVSTKGRVYGSPAGVLTNNDQSAIGHTLTRLARMWTAGGEVCHAMLLDNLEGVNRWQRAPAPSGGLWIEDRSGGELNKIYASRVSTGSEALSGTWKSSTSYRVQRSSSLVAALEAASA